MRVLQAMAGAEWGGAEAFFVRLAIAFEKAGLEQRVVIRRNAERASILRAGGISPVELPFGGAFDFKTGGALKKQIKDFKPDIVLTWMNRATKMCPKGDFVHVARLGGYYDLKYYQRCDHLVGNTEDIVDYLGKQGWPREKAHYLPNFVNSERVAPLSRKQFFTPERAPLVLGLGRLHENKAFDTLLRAIARVPDAYLWLAGDGPLRGELEKLAEELAIKPRVRFLGWRDDTAALFATADLFVCPSRHEPLGNVVIESWAQGVPVVAADSLGPGTLIEQEKNGILVPIDDPVSLGNAIKYTFQDSDMAAGLAEAGYAAFKENFTEQKVVDRYVSFFESILANRTPKDS